MKKGYFNNKGELFFEMDLIAIDDSIVTVDTILDTGFTDWDAKRQAIEEVHNLGNIKRLGNTTC